MNDPQFASMITQFRQALTDCRELYVSAGRLVAAEHADLLKQSPQAFVQLMDDLQQV